MGDDDWAAHAEPDDVDRIRRLGQDHLVVDDELLHETGAAAPVLLGPGDADIAGVVELFLPGAAVLDKTLLAFARVHGRLVGLEPAANLVAESLLLRAELEIHEA